LTGKGGKAIGNCPSGPERKETEVTALEHEKGKENKRTERAVKEGRERTLLLLLNNRCALWGGYFDREKQKGWKSWQEKRG